MFQQFVTNATNILMFLGYPGILVAMILEGLSIPFPGTIIIIFAGYMVLEGHVTFWFAVVVAAIGYTIGSLVPYFLAYAGRTAIFKKASKFIPISPRKFIIARKWFNRYGSSMVCFSRPFFFGNYISYLAGMARMRPLKYIIYTFFGAFIWCTGLVFVGRLFGNKWMDAIDVISHYSTKTIIVLIVFVAVFFLFFYKKV